FEAGTSMKTNKSWTKDMATPGDSCRNPPDFPEISDTAGQIPALWSECRRSRIQGVSSPMDAPSSGGAQAATENLRVESHDIYEKEGTYSKNTRVAEKRIRLIKSLLAVHLEMTEGELKVEAKATMLQKTKEVKSCNLIKATMLMKINDLKF